MKVEKVILVKVAGFLQSGAKRRLKNPRQPKGHLIITEVSPSYRSVSSRHEPLKPNFLFITYRPELLVSKA